MRHLILLLTATLFLAGCTAGMMIAKRDSVYTGHGTFGGIGKEVSIVFGNKSCSGHYASVRDRSEIGLTGW